MEIYQLTIKLPPGAEDDCFWKRVIEVPEDFSLYELHNYIQQIIEFDNAHLFAFYIGKNHRKREIIFREDDYTEYEEYESIHTKLNEIYPITGKKLYYLFDFGDYWLFEIKKRRKKQSVQKGINYPKIITSEGKNPDQYADFPF